MNTKRKKLHKNKKLHKTKSKISMNTKNVITIQQA